MSPFPRVIYRPLEPYAPDRRPVEVDLSDNTNRWGVHPAALRLLRQADPEDLLRYPPVYADGLREAVARRFGVPVEAVSTGCGSDDLLDSAFRAACDPGEGVRFVPPTFSMIEIFARMNALVPQPVEREAPAGPESPFGPLPDPERLFERAPGVVYLCRPNNPTGEVHPRAWVDRVVEEADRTGVVLLLDEAYADFMEGSTSDLLRRAAGTRRVVVLRTMSKAYGLAGLRVGFA
ncbi:MAG: aminotransferase class I/II-fold pyridoxal phosphate-dependent enzyme, partial [Gemmatimonadota bacterium]